MMFRTASSIFICVILAGAALDALADGSRRELQLRQQQDALNLTLQQSLRAPRHHLSPSDARRLDQLDLEQRLQQQQLEQQQTQRDERVRREASDAQLRVQRDIYAQERALQMQQFEIDRRRLLQSMPREPLQSPAGGTLRLP